MTPSNLARLIALRKTILDATEEINKLLNPKPQWEPEGGNWMITPTDVHLSYPSEEAGKAVIPQLRTYTRLLAYVQEFDTHQLKDCYIFRSASGIWTAARLSSPTFYPDTIIMSELCANALCDKLHSGEVVL